MDEVCEGCTCSFITDRPLGWYIFLCLVNLIPVVLLGGVGAIDDCDDAPGAAVSAGSAVLALLHLGFAFYFQCRLIRGLESVEAPTAEELSKRAGDILLYDVGFCVYAIIFLMAFFFNCYAAAASLQCSNAAGTLAAILSILFAFLAFAFMILWFCCLHCCYGVVSKVVNPRTVHLGPKGQGHATGPTIVGVPVGAAASGAAPSGGTGGGATAQPQSGSQASSLAQVGISVAGQFAGRLLQGGQQKR